jgi:hypothetical protein
MGHDRLKLARSPEEQMFYDRVEQNYSRGRVDEDEEDEDEDELPPWRQSGRECDCCGEGLPYCEEVFVLEIAEAAGENGQIFHDILRDDEGEYLYRPYMMHVACWEEVLEAIDEAIADTPPAEAEQAILTCSRCESTIGNFEPFVASTFGEISVSDRRPSGKPSAFFEPMSSVTPVCLLCIQHVVEDHLDEWEELLEALPEIEYPGEKEDE